MPHISSCQVGGYYTKSMRETRCLRTGPILAVDDMDSGFWLTLSPFHSSCMHRERLMRCYTLSEIQEAYSTHLLRDSTTRNTIQYENGSRCSVLYTLFVKSRSESTLGPLVGYPASMATDCCRAEDLNDWPLMGRWRIFDTWIDIPVLGGLPEPRLFRATTKTMMVG